MKLMQLLFILVVLAQVACTNSDIEMNLVKGQPTEVSLSLDSSMEAKVQEGGLFRVELKYSGDVSEWIGKCGQCVLVEGALPTSYLVSPPNIVYYYFKANQGQPTVKVSIDKVKLLHNLKQVNVGSSAVDIRVTNKAHLSFDQTLHALTLSSGTSSGSIKVVVRRSGLKNQSVRFKLNVEETIPTMNSQISFHDLNQERVLFENESIKEIEIQYAYGSSFQGEKEYLIKIECLDNTLCEAQGISRLEVVASGTSAAEKILVQNKGSNAYGCSKSHFELSCWGYNGAGTASDVYLIADGVMKVLSPVKVLSLSTDFDFALGSQNICILVSQKVYCWGRVGSGVLPSHVNSYLPSFPLDSSLSGLVEVTLPSGVVPKSIHGAGDRFCILTIVKNLYCWGRIGLSDADIKTEPFPILSGISFIKVSVGVQHICGVREDNKLYCWGRNIEGQLGDGATSNLNHDSGATTVLSDGQVLLVKNVAVGETHTCAVNLSDQLWCWGSNGNYKVGQWSGSTFKNPVKLSIPDGLVISGLILGKTNTCYWGTKLGRSSLYCFGAGASGRIGNGLTYDTAQFQKIFDDVVDVGMSQVHGCLVIGSGRSYCWGESLNGELGIGLELNTKNISPTRAITDGTEFVSLARGHEWSFAVDSDSKLWAWGRNSDFQLGFGDTLERGVPTKSNVFDKSVLMVSSALGSDGDQGCLIDVSNYLYCWGLNKLAQVFPFQNSAVSKPLLVFSDKKFSFVDNSEFNTCAIDMSGAIWCRGKNSKGQLGVGTTSTVYDDFSWHQVRSDKKFIKVRNGVSFTCGLSDEKDLFCWGANDVGQLAQPLTVTESPLPLKVDGLKFNDFTIGRSSICAIQQATLDLYCWGYNGNGELGIGSQTNQVVPTKVTQVSSLKKIDMGTQHTCAVTSSDEVKCWGGSANGQVVVGATRKTSPYVIDFSATDIQGPIKDVIAGSLHSCILDQKGIICWGGNDFGQLGYHRRNFKIPGLVHY